MPPTGIILAVVFGIVIIAMVSSAVKSKKKDSSDSEQGE